MNPAEAAGATAVIAIPVSWWKELLISFLSSLPGLLFFMYIVARWLAHWQGRVVSLENERTQARPFCLIQQEVLIKKAEAVAESTVSSALKDLIIQNNQQLFAVSTNLALLNQSNETIREDIKEIFMRLNRRSDDPLYTEQYHGRRSTDGP